MAIIIFMTLLVAAGNLFAQTPKAKTRKLIVGFNTAGFLATFKGVYPTYQRMSALAYEVEPHAGIFLWQSWAAGISGSYGRVHSDFLPEITYYDFGYWARFYVPLHRKRDAFRFGKTQAAKRFLPFLQLSHQFGNSYILPDTNIRVQRAAPNVQWLSPAVGFDLRLRNNLFFEIIYLPEFYLNVPAQNNWFNLKLGLNYIWDPVDRQREVQRRLTGKYSRRLQIKRLPGKDSTARFFPFNKLILGTNLTYIFDVAHSGGVAIQGSFFRELSWHLNAATPLTRRLYLGFNYIQQFTSDPFSGSNRFRMAGPYLQFDFIPNRLKSTSSIRRVDRVYVELGGYKGNYCTCDPDNPYGVENLGYVGVGIGLDYRLNKWLHLDAGFSNYQILNDVLGKYNYTQYIIGLDFHLFNWKKSS